MTPESGRPDMAARTQLAAMTDSELVFSPSGLPLRQTRGKHRLDESHRSVVEIVPSDPDPRATPWTTNVSTVAATLAALKELSVTPPSPHAAKSGVFPVGRTHANPEAAKPSTPAPTSPVRNWSSSTDTASVEETPLPTRRSLREATERSQPTGSRASAGLFTRILTVRAFRAHQSQLRRTSAPVAAVGEVLRAAAVHGVLTLHHRRVPGQRGRVDYLAVSASGVYVIDVKHHKNAPIELRTKDHRTDTGPDLIVSGRVMTTAAIATSRRVSAVRTVLNNAGLDNVPVTGAICFVDGLLPLGVANIEVRGIHILRQSSLTAFVSTTGSLDPEHRRTIQEYLAEQLPRAS